MKAPLFPAAVAICVGILLAEWTACSPALPFFIGAISAAAFLLLPRSSSVVLLVAMGSLGAFRQSTVSQPLSAADFRNAGLTLPLLAQVEARVANYPVAQLLSNGITRTTFVAELIRFKQHQRSDRHWRATSGKVLVKVNGTMPGAIDRGVQLRFTGALVEPEKPWFRHSFDYSKHLQRQDLFCMARTDAEEIEVLSNHEISLATRFRRWGNAVLAHGVPADEATQLNQVITFGGSSALFTDADEEAFTRSGTMHIFAVSGFHVALLAGMLTTVAQVLRLRREWACLAVLPALAFYSEVTGGEPSAVRAAVMSAVLILSWAVRRPVHGINSIALASSILLLWEPRQLFSPGFQLSFVVVATLALFHPLEVTHLADKAVELEKVQPASVLAVYGRKFIRTFLAGLVAWAGSIPLVLYHFNLLTPIAVLANLVMIPLSSLALISNFSSIAIAPLSTELSVLFNNGSWFWMNLLIQLAHFHAEIPFAWQALPKATGLEIISFYAVAISSVLALKERRWFPLFVAGTVLLVGMCGGARWLSSQIPRLYLLPFKQSTGFLLTQGSRQTLIDTGDDHELYRLRQLLQETGTAKLDELILWHDHARAISGAKDLLHKGQIRSVITARQVSRSPRWRQFIDQAERELQVDRVDSGGSVADWQILHGGSRAAGSARLVISREILGWRLLFVPTLRRGEFEELFANPLLAPRCDLLLVVWQEERLHDLAEVIRRTNPRLVALLDAERPISRSACDSLYRQLKENGGELMVRSRTGAVELVINKKQIDIHPQFGVPRQLDRSARR